MSCSNHPCQRMPYCRHCCHPILYFRFQNDVGPSDACVHEPPGRHDEARQPQAQPEQAPISSEQVRTDQIEFCFPISRHRYCNENISNVGSDIMVALVYFDRPKCESPTRRVCVYRYLVEPRSLATTDRCVSGHTSGCRHSRESGC